MLQERHGSRLLGLLGAAFLAGNLVTTPPAFGQASGQLSRIGASPSLKEVVLVFREPLSSTVTPNKKHFTLKEVDSGNELQIEEVCSVASSCVKVPGVLPSNELHVRLQTGQLDVGTEYRLKVDLIDFATAKDESDLVLDFGPLNKATFVESGGGSTFLLQFLLPIDDDNLPSEIEVNGKKRALRVKPRGAPLLFLEATVVGTRVFNGSQVKLTGVMSDTRPSKEMTFEGKVERPVPKGRDDAREFVSFSFASEDGKDEVFTFDIKIAELLKYLGRGWSLFGNLDAKFSSDEAGNDDSLVFALGGERAFLRGNGLGGAVLSIRLPQVETDKDFENTNLIADFEVFLSVPKWTWAALRFDKAKMKYESAARHGYLNPYLGLEVGGDSPFGKEDTPSYDVRRGTARLVLNLTWPLPKRTGESVSLDISYTARYLFEEELINVEEEDDEGEKIRVVREIDSELKDYIEASFNYSISDQYTITAKYEYGELPPLFELVDKLSAGITLKF